MLLRSRWQPSGNNWRRPKGLRIRLKDPKLRPRKARDKAEQKGYDLEVAKTDETLKAEVPAVCCIYYAQTWNEALNWARVEASSELRKAKNIKYPPAIRALDLPSTQAEVASTVADPIKEAQPQDPSLPNQ